MNIVKTWKKYMAPEDEREEMEVNRITTRAFYALMAAMIVLSYYLIQLDQVAVVNDLDTNQFEHLGTIAIAICTIVSISCLYIVVAETRRGIVGSACFGNTESFPASFGMAVSAIGGGAATLMIWGSRTLAEIVLVGAANAHFLANLAVGVVFFPVVFVCIYAALYLAFKNAKKKQAKILKALEEDEY